MIDPAARRDEDETPSEELRLPAAAGILTMLILCSILLALKIEPERARGIAPDSLAAIVVGEAPLGSIGGEVVFASPHPDERPLPSDATTPAAQAASVHRAAPARPASPRSPGDATPPLDRAIDGSVASAAGDVTGPRPHAPAGDPSPPARETAPAPAAAPAPLAAPDPDPAALPSSPQSGALTTAETTSVPRGGYRPIQLRTDFSEFDGPAGHPAVRRRYAESAGGARIPNVVTPLRTNIWSPLIEVSLIHLGPHVPHDLADAFRRIVRHRDPVLLAAT